MKHLLLTLIFLLISLFHASPAHAQLDFLESIDLMNPAGPLQIQLFSRTHNASIINDLICRLMGCTDSTGTTIDMGAAPSTTNFIAQMVTDPPVKTSTYIADVAGHIGIVSPAYAQGLGYSALTPVLTVWKAFRNLAYFLFILIFIVVGFMIMFRAQINPQTVVTIQSALPKMVLSLLLITFSYAIAGFVVDLIYLVMFVVIGVLNTVGVVTDTAQARDVLFNLSVFRIGFSYLIFDGTAGTSAGSITSVIASALGLNATGALAKISSNITFLVVAIAIVIALFRTLFALVMAWISIVLSVIFAPPSNFYSMPYPT